MSGKDDVDSMLAWIAKSRFRSVMIDGEDAWDLSASVKARIGYVDHDLSFIHG